jgi:hypothetical protein
MTVKNLYLTIPVGQSVRDFLLLGVAARILELLPDFRLVLLTPSYNVPAFLELCPKHERLLVRRMEIPYRSPNWRFIHWRRKLHNRVAMRVMLAWEAQRMRLPSYLAPTFQELPPSLVVSTHPLTSYDYDVVMWARRLRIQTAGVVKSWDNVGKGLASQTHLLSVWNPVNQDEAIRLHGYRPDEVTINGAVSFDPYYNLTYTLPRAEFFTSLDLDPSRPVITLATGGVMMRGYQGRDEAYLAEDILHMIGESEVLKKAQLVIRLHANSRLEYFWKYWNRPGIKISFVSYMPGTGWCPTHEDVFEQVNLLRHSDVIVTPVSSWALEVAMFDTPTVAPVYSDLQPDHAAAQYDQWSLARHFKPLVENKWVPITRSYGETRTAIEEALTQPNKYASGRQAIIDNYVYYRDGDSCQRVAAWIADIAKTVQPGKPRGF